MAGALSRAAVSGTRAYTACRSRAALFRRRRRDIEVAREQGWPRIVPLVSLPHSGGTWLAELLTEVPGYARRPIRDPDGCTAEHDVCQAVFESLPADRLSVVKLHTRPRRANVELLERLALRTVVLDRDLRDQCVSRYFHVLADPWHRHHDHYSNGPKHDALTHSVSVTLDEYLPWVVGWREASARSGTFLSVGYEELRQDPAATLGRILGFLGIDLPPVEPAAIVDRVERRTRFELSPRSLARGSTARRGVVGDWRNHLSAEQIKRFRVRT